MPFVLILAGVVLLVAAVRNTQACLFKLLAADFSGPDNFLYWVVAILIVGALGYIPKVKPVSDGFLILLIVVLFLKRGTGFFDQAIKQLGGTQSVTGSGSSSAIPPFGGKGAIPPLVIPYDPSIPVIK